MLYKNVTAPMTTGSHFTGSARACSVQPAFEPAKLPQEPQLRRRGLTAEAATFPQVLFVPLIARRGGSAPHRSGKATATSHAPEVGFAGRLARLNCRIWVARAFFANAEARGNGRSRSRRLFTRSEEDRGGSGVPGSNTAPKAVSL